MANSFTTPDGDLENLYITDYNFIDRYVTTGSLWAWGVNVNGQLGTNNTTSYSSPVQTISGGNNWKQASAGSDMAAAIKTDGTLWLWGTNSYGGLGTNDLVSYSSPVQTIASGTNWKLVQLGQWFSFAIKNDGTLWGWGQNTSGQLGTNDATKYSSPVQTVSGGNNWKQVTCGQIHTLAIKTDGTLWVWGGNNFGQLGTNNRTNYSSPVQTVSGGTNWKTLMDGYCATTRSAAIKTDGTLWMWGSNPNGAMGDNTSGNNYSSPIQTIAGGNNWKSVSTSLSGATCAIKIDGTLWVWGNNTAGQLGTGDTTPQSSPVQTVAGGNNWKQCGSSGNQTYAGMGAVKTDGTLWTWGSSGAYGIGGRNNLTNVSSPAQTIAAGTNWKSITYGTQCCFGIYFYDAGNLYPSK